VKVGNILFVGILAAVMATGRAVANEPLRAVDPLTGNVYIFENGDWIVDGGEKVEVKRVESAAPTVYGAMWDCVHPALYLDGIDGKICPDELYLYGDTFTYNEYYDTYMFDRIGTDRLRALGLRNEEPVQALQLAAAPAGSNNIVINVDVELDERAPSCGRKAAGGCRAKSKVCNAGRRLKAFDDALDAIRAGHPAPTYPNPFTNVQNVYLFENNITVIGGGFDEARESYGRVNCDVRAERCPFRTAEECEVWRRKPVVRTGGSESRGPSIERQRLCIIIDELRQNRRLPVESVSGRALIGAHRLMLNNGRRCCVDAATDIIKKSGGTAQDAEGFVSGNAEFLDRCIAWSEDEIEKISGGGSFGEFLNEVQNRCFAVGGTNIRKMLTPFVQLFNSAPDLEELPLDYDYTDPQGQARRVSITDDVKVITSRLAND